jgi:hypothetical protein
MLSARRYSVYSLRLLWDGCAVLPRVTAAIHQIDPFIAVSGEESLTVRIARDGTVRSFR